MKNIRQLSKERIEANKALIKRAAAVIVILLLLALGFLARAFFSGRFSSPEELREYMKTFGTAAPLVLTAFQAAQVVVPVLPGAIGYAAGTVLFGVPIGFVCNYIGICIGSIISYFLAKKLGIELVLSMFSEEQYVKWQKKVESSKYFMLIFWLSILLPFFPDDFLCYFAGLMKMDAKKFITIIIVAKPWCILGYCLLFKVVV